MMTRRLVATTAALVLCLGLAACSDDDPAPPKPTSKPSSSSASTPADQPRTLTFGAFGHPEELEAFDQVVDSFNAASQTRKIKLVTWANHEQALEAVLAGEAPDVFMTARRDLLQVANSKTTRPVSLLLDERGIDFGDRYSRDALEAFSYEDDLQCMPYSVSPMVMYFNSELVDFDRMERRGFDVPTVVDDVRSDRWTMSEFAAAAEWASRRGTVDGVWIDPTLRGLAPFIYSGGGKIFDDDSEPKSLAFADDGTRSALDQTLTILRDPILTPSADELRNATALQLFKRGKLAMISTLR